MILADLHKITLLLPKAAAIEFVFDAGICAFKLSKGFDAAVIPLLALCCGMVVVSLVFIFGVAKRNIKSIFLLPTYLIVVVVLVIGFLLACTAIDVALLRECQNHFCTYGGIASLALNISKGLISIFFMLRYRFVTVEYAWQLRDDKPEDLEFSTNQ
ncbi:hypothetical protein DSO57_1021327 [Entomophthora muscae]|uniref:Uncharacterized protein n=1 Tax=Entomophthora muscae TaxID=34485 RepID=A0ACC2U1G6_9FUNG|nr:hypothetical protein DSO57_1021327 [Entomophthora muscae]